MQGDTTTTPTKTNSSTSSSSAALASSSSSSGDATSVDSAGENNEPSRAGNKRKADGAHPEDPERKHGKWMRTEQNKRKSVEEDEGCMVKKTVRYTKTLQKAEAKREAGGVQEIVGVAEVESRRRSTS